MKIETLKKSAVIGSGLVAAIAAQASTDYPGAIYNPPCNANYYTSGSGHNFGVIHDMEGYYASTISMFNSCSFTAASIHYLINGKSDASSDAPGGEVTQMVRESNYAWHVICWNTHCWGTEHEGFASNPAWYTEHMYQSSVNLSRHLADAKGYAKDRNHIVGHNEWQHSAWRTYASANLGIDPNCNTHTDPGPNWDWSHYMDLMNNAMNVGNRNSGYSSTGTWTTGSGNTQKYGTDYFYHGTSPGNTDYARWTGTIATTGYHAVYAWWPADTNRSTQAKYKVYNSGGTSPATVIVNQRIDGGQWNMLGIYQFNAGNHSVDLSCDAPSGDFVIADTVRWQ